MGTFLSQATHSAKQIGWLTNWFLTSPSEPSVDQAAVAIWRAENRDMIRRASARAELPPLPSH